MVRQLMDTLAMAVPMPAARKAKELVAEDEQEKSESDARYVGRLR